MRSQVSVGGYDGLKVAKPIGQRSTFPVTTFSVGASRQVSPRNRKMTQRHAAFAIDPTRGLSAQLHGDLTIFDTLIPYLSFDEGDAFESCSIPNPYG